jgi:pimeloyl-ACP methyl ester carboxylesterase
MADDRTIDVQIRGVEQRLLTRYGMAATERMVSVTGSGDLRVRTLELGAGSPGTPVVLLHGIFSVSAAGYPLLPYLSDRRIIVVDWLGHGLADPFVMPRRVDLAGHADTVLSAVLDAYDITRADLIGHSMGAFFSMRYALRQPTRVRRVVTLGAMGPAFVETQPPAVFKLLATPMLGPAMLSVPISAKQYRHNNDGLLGPTALEGHPDEIIEVAYLSTKRPHVARSHASFARRFLSPFTVRSDVSISHAELATMPVPVLIVWGESDVVLSPVAAAPSITAIPQASVLTLAAGHAPWLDEPEKVGGRIAEFLS